MSVYFAVRNKIDLSINIAVGSAAQIALFVAPVLVLSSFLIGPFPMALVFNGFEIGAIFLAVLIAQGITQRGDTTWTAAAPACRHAWTPARTDRRLGRSRGRTARSRRRG